MLKVKSTRGRPRKFGRSARSITLTLPEDVISMLSGMNPDLARAIVTLVEQSPKPKPTAAKGASMASYGNSAVILVPQVKALRRVPGVQLVPIGDGKALIALEQPQSVAQLELDLRDALDRGKLEPGERPVLEGVADILRSARQSNALTMVERSIIVLEGRRRRAH